MMKSNTNMPMCERRMDAGALSGQAQAFAEGLVRLGHTTLTVQNYTDSARHFADWLNRSGLALSDVDDRVVQRFADHRCRCPGCRRLDHVSKKYVQRVKRFLRFLEERGLIRASTRPPLTSVNGRVLHFQDWLRQHRGISEPTIERHGRMIVRLLPALGDDPAAYDAGLVRRVILEEARRCSPAYVKTMAMALRGYLRFLTAQGACQPWLDQAVPIIPHWRLSALPRYLAPADVERLIASCDRTMPGGVRDRAILLLLVRLGLRAGDVLAMRLGDIAWEDGTLQVCGKGRREILLPLPQDAGDALFDYLERSRPTTDSDRVFLRAVAPHRPFAGPCAISDVVHKALARAGITDAPSKGANLLRHSAATAMLRAGATLDAIGAVLRHRSADTTAHYAKVDIPMLSRIAQPWPGDLPC